MALLDLIGNSIFGLGGGSGPQFNLGSDSTYQTDNQFVGSVLDLEGNIGPSFDLGKDSTLQLEQNTSVLTNSNLFTTEGGQQDSLFDLGPDSTLHDPDSILEEVIIPVSNYQYDNTPGVAGPSTLDLNNNPGPQFNGNPPYDAELQSLHVDSLTQEYNYQHGQNPWLATDTVGPSTLDLEGTDGGQGYFHNIANPGKGNGLQINGTDLHIHLLTQEYTYNHGDSIEKVGPSPGPTGYSEFQDLDGAEGFFQGTKRQRDAVNRKSLNSVPGGVTPSQYADLNNKPINVNAPNGAPVPNSTFFTQQNGEPIDRPTLGQGFQIGDVDLHEHLLTNKYQYYRGGTTGISPFSETIGGRFDLNGETPSQYTDIDLK